MLNRKILLVSCLVVSMLIFSACSAIDKNQTSVEKQQEAESTPQSEKGQKQMELTVDDIKQSFTDREVVNVTSYGKNALVETHQDTFANRFYWYDLKTGDRDILPTSPDYAALEKIVNEDIIVFTADGRNDINGYRSFPYTITCTRSKGEDLDSEFDFSRSDSRKYLDLDEKVTFGRGGSAQIADVRMTFDGLEVLFKPVKGKEAEFYAAYTGIPITKTYYQDQDAFVIEFGNTEVAPELKQEALDNEENSYLKGCEIEQGKDNTRLILKLKDTVKYYNAFTEHLIKDQLPIVQFHFSEQQPIDPIPVSSW